MDNSNLYQSLPDTYQEIKVEDLSLADQRAVLFNLLYAAESLDYDVSLESIVDNFDKGYNLIIDKNSVVFKQTQSIINERHKLDEAIKPFLANWRFERIGVSTKLILRYAFWELQNTEQDPILVINEAVELAKCFAEKDSYKFINGILDRYIKEKGLKLE
jgi:transcription antitermination protein NusB